ncbi:MAG: hypothetical protein K2X11_07295 [Acetobacteraceae bacterium]|nr:hypothetical protein [Acetobacteraceae bacterium]
MKSLTTHLAAALIGAVIGGAGLASAQLGQPLQANFLYHLAPGQTTSIVCQAPNGRVTAPSGTVQPMSLGPMARFTGLAVACAP